MYPIPCFYTIISNNPLANSISLTSLGTCLKGGKAQLIWSVVPEGADLHDITFTPDKPTIVSVDPTGLVSFLEDGDFIITMSAKTGKGDEEKTLTAQINGHIDTLRIDVDSIGIRSINDRFWFVYKGDPSFDPGNPNMIGFNISPAEVMEEDDFYVTAVSETPAILSLAPSGIITCVRRGVGYCGMKGTYKDVTVTTLRDVHVGAQVRSNCCSQQLVVDSKGEVIIGSWVDGAGHYGNYVASGAGDGLRIHYRPTIYENAAISLANMEDLSSTPPAWVDMKVPSGGKAVRQANQDILLSWDTRDYNKFFIVNFDVLTGAVISQQTLTTNSYTFTYADQVKQYGYAAGTVLFGVAYVQTTSKGDITSPLVKFNINVA